MSRIRPHDWVTRLDEFIAQRRPMEFRWGANDCAQFACAWLRALHEEDPLEVLALPPYRTEREAARLLKAHGGLHQLATAYLGDPLVHKLTAQRGDIVLVQNDGRASLGVCVGWEVAGPGASGLEFVGLDTALAAWRA